MVSEDLQRRVQTGTNLPRLVYALILAGLMTEMTVLVIGIALGISTGDYYTNTKAVRDAAIPGGDGSGILSQIGTISAVQVWLQPLKFVGVALFFTGIGVALWTIVGSVQLRGEAMRVALPAVMARRMSGGNGS